jgi:hypothetical protein
MSEINHRAKNMFSVVDAIACQSATRTPEASLSPDQDLLIGNAWQGVAIEGPGLRPARSHVLSYRGGRPQAVVECGFGSSRRARAA